MMVEALCALLLSALVLTGLTNLLSLMARAGDRAVLQAERVEVDTRLAVTLRREIEGATRVRWAGADGAFVFSGTPDQVRFATAPDGPEGASRFVVIQAVRDPQGTRVVRAEGALPAVATGPDDVVLGPSEALARGGFILRYAGRAAPDATDVITEAWPSGSRMPGAVLLTLADGRTERIELKIDGAPGCASVADLFCSERVDGGGER